MQTDSQSVGRGRWLPFLMIIGLGLPLWGCGVPATVNNEPGAAGGSPRPATVAREGVYTCPMHPEVTGKAGEDCPKCGMELKPKEGSTAPGGIGMRFSTEPATFEPNQEVQLMMTPVSKVQPDARIGLDVEHEKKIHLIVVKEDLSWFDHIHPEEDSGGSYRVTEKFPAPGRYMLFADYKPTGGDHVVDRLNVNVEGTPAPAEIYGGDRLKSDAGDGFTAVLSAREGSLATGQPVHLQGTIFKDGKELDVNTLENYLGAKAHMVVISLEDKEYLHVHPGVEGSTFDLHTTFEKPGIHRGWLQFQSAGKVYTSDFVFDVVEGQATSGETTETPNGEHTGH